MLSLRQNFYQMSKLYSFFISLLFCCMYFNSAYAQPQKGEFINASAGIGVCFADDESDASGSGFYTQAEYVWSPRSWFGVRPYVGIVTASGESDEQDTQQFKIKSNTFLLGAKIRLVAPIPYVAPFLETGIGMSAGSFETYTAHTNLKKNGVLLHVPLTLGLALGRKHSTEIKFVYYFHESTKQTSGAMALGFSFPL